MQGSIAPRSCRAQNRVASQQDWEGADGSHQSRGFAYVWVQSLGEVDSHLSCLDSFYQFQSVTSRCPENVGPGKIEEGDFIVWHREIVNR